MGYLKRDLSSEDKQELLGPIEDYRQERPNCIVATLAEPYWALGLGLTG
jgi:uncharacterized protein YbgA (DUF1722 family)